MFAVGVLEYAADIFEGALHHDNFLAGLKLRPADIYQAGCGIGAGAEQLDQLLRYAGRFTAEPDQIADADWWNGWRPCSAPKHPYARTDSGRT